jgi:CheY-like chemotaxis protein
VNLHSDEAGDRGLFVATRHQLDKMLNAGASLEDLLIEIVELVERQSGGMLCSILLVEEDGKHFRVGAAPNLPAAYNALFQQVVIGEGVGSCGTAAHRKELVIVSDIERDPLWANYKEFALPYGLRACWSCPIWLDTQVVGTFACYYQQPRSPESDELRTIEAVAGLASDIIRSFRSRSATQRLGAKTVLVVEDDDQFRELVCAFLKMDGHEPLEAANSECALSIWDEHSNRIELVITDVDLPGINGLDLAAKLAGKRSGAKILLMSANPVVCSDTFMFLPKPFSRADLQRKITSIFSRFRT